MTDKQSIYDRVTETILQQIEASPGDPVMPWHRPAGSALHIPKNATTDSAYRGINILMLWIAADMKHYPTGLWASYKQWAGVGAQVRKGEKAAQVVFYRQYDVEPTAEDDDGKRRLLRTSSVFNAAQVDNFDTPSLEASDHGPVRRSAEFDRFVAATGARINHAGHSAFYSLASDEITMPEETCFVGTPTMDRDLGYMSVLAHELGHYSGAKHRLDRQLGNRFGTQAHAAEEIIAELTAAFICAELGLVSEPRADHAQYISHYLRLLRDDSRAIFTAAAAASKATEYLFSFSKSPGTRHEATSPIATPPSTSCDSQTTATISSRSTAGLLSSPSAAQSMGVTSMFSSSSGREPTSTAPSAGCAASSPCEGPTAGAVKRSRSHAAADTAKTSASP